MPLALLLSACGGDSKSSPDASDTTPPSVVSVLPEDLATDVAVGTPVSVTLDEAVDPASVSTDSFTLSDTSGAVSLSNENQTITFTPGADLSEGTEYTATLAASVTDLAGNALGADKVWSFTTVASVTRVVYTIYEASQHSPLLRTDMEGGAIIGHDKLSDPAWTTGQVSWSDPGFAISPDGSTVAMIARTTDSSPRELFVVPVTGGTPLKVSGTIAGGGSVFNESLKWSPDSSKIAFLATEESASVYYLYVVTADGQTKSMVNPELAGNQRVESFHWSPDSNLIAYTSDQLVEQDWRLVISAPDGSNNRVVPKSNGYRARAFSDRRIAWSPESSHLAYIGENGAARKLIKVAVSDLVQSDLSTPVFTDSDRLTWSPEGSAVASLLRTGNHRLVVSPVDGTAHTATTMAADRRVREYAWSPDGSLLAYTSDEDTLNAYELIVMAPDGTGLVEVSESLGDTARVSGYTARFEWAPDSQRLLFGAAPLVQSEEDVFTVSRAGDSLQRLTDRKSTMTFGGAGFSADGSKVFAIWDTDTGRKIYAVALDGSGSIPVMDPSITDDVAAYQLVDDTGVSLFNHED